MLVDISYSYFTVSVTTSHHTHHRSKLQASHSWYDHISIALKKNEILL